MNEWDLTINGDLMDLTIKNEDLMGFDHQQWGFNGI